MNRICKCFNIKFFLYSIICIANIANSSPRDSMSEGKEEEDSTPTSTNALAQSNSDLMPKFRGFSSLINPHIGDHVKEFISDAKEEILIGSDQFRDYKHNSAQSTFLTSLINIKKKTGTEFKFRIVTTKYYDGNKYGELGGENNGKYIIPSSDDLNHIDYTSIIPKKSITGNHGLMHSKFVIIDGKKVLTGSPNFTYAGHHLNVENMLSIDHPAVATLYKQYYNYIVEPGINHFDNKTPIFMELKSQIEKFNKEDNFPLKICMAPLIKVPDFIREHLQGNNLISISMFIVGDRAHDEDDSVINMLLNKLKINQNLKIDIKVDKDSYFKKKWMQEALERLLIYNKQVKVSISQNDRGIMHDKLILLQGNPIQPRVIIGSAGFTDHVYDNKNIENMVMAKDQEIYDFFNSHYQKIRTESTNKNSNPGNKAFDNFQKKRTR